MLRERPLAPHLYFDFLKADGIYGYGCDAISGVGLILVTK